MDLAELKRQIDEMPLSQRGEYRKVFSFTAVGGKAWPCLEKHLEQAGTVREFLESVYEDDACRGEGIWALWAKMSRKRWVSRFEPEQALTGIVLEGKGVIVEGGGNQMLIPVPGRGKTLGVYLFPEDGFNADAAEFYCSISGSFTCYDMQLEGTFDVYRAERALIFERWALDKLGRRESSKRRCQKSSCSCCS